MATAELQIYCCPVAAIEPAQVEACISLLDAPEQQRLAQFHGAGPRREFILSRGLLRTVLAARLQVAPNALQFERDHDGKPRLAAPIGHLHSRQWHFNLSHSREWVALALSDAGPVGVDIESHRRENDLVAIARRFFSAAENAALGPALASDPRWLARFFAIWTLKEAHAKALGCGLSKILSCSSFIPAADFPAPVARARIDLELTGIAAAAQAVSTWLYRPDPQTSLAVSQLGAQLSTQPRVTVLQRWLPRQEGTTSFELVPIAAGHWRPGAPDTQNANPRA
jgi:4'-phosphopantetheinyl transferase